VAADEQRIIAQLPETGIFDPDAFRHFSTEGATVVRLYADQELSVVTWNLEEGQENALHRHGDNALGRTTKPPSSASATTGTPSPGRDELAAARQRSIAG